MMVLIDKAFMMMLLMMMMMTMTPTRPSMMLGSWDSIRKSQVACKGWFNELDDWYCLVLSSMNWVALFVCYHLKSRDELTKSSAQLFHKINNLLCTRFGWLWWFSTSGEGCGDSPGVVIHHCWWRISVLIPACSVLSSVSQLSRSVTMSTQILE